MGAKGVVRVMREGRELCFGVHLEDVVGGGRVGVGKVSTVFW